MFGRLFGRKKEQVSPPTPPPADLGPSWGASETAFENFFNLHFHGISLDETVRALEATYMPLAVDGPNIVVADQGEWTTAYFAPELMARVGFNKLAGQIADARDIWVIGYRVYAGVGMDVHYFRGEDHVAGLAMADDAMEVEPANPAIFAELADVSALLPRPEKQHPLDFHFGLLAALGIADAALTWPQAQARHANGTLGESRLLAVE
jgi:hypothetical protein